MNTTKEVKEKYTTITLPLSTHEKLKAYSKYWETSTRKIVNILVEEAIKKDLYFEVIKNTKKFNIKDS